MTNNNTNIKIFCNKTWLQKYLAGKIKQISPLTILIILHGLWYSHSEDESMTVKPKLNM